jgi:hypothetical protein
MMRGDKKNTFKEGTDVKGSIGLSMGLKAQNTIPLNFFEDLKIGIDVDEKEFGQGGEQ